MEPSYGTDYAVETPYAAGVAQHQYIRRLPVGPALPSTGYSYTVARYRLGGIPEVMVAANVSAFQAMRGDRQPATFSRPAGFVTRAQRNARNN
jgi:hypothetical protein